MFLSNEVVQTQENQSSLLNELAQFALTNELALKMRKRVFLDWYDKDPDSASVYAESQTQDASLLEVLNMKRQISSLKSRLGAISPASENYPVSAEIQSQITLIENQLAALSSF
jgi:hypothetical protein